MRPVVALLAILLATAAARADEATARAKQSFQRAEALYALTKYDEALAEYEKAYEAKPLPGFLFNIGQCHKNLGHWDKAAHFYREYLERVPRAGNRKLVESLIDEMDGRAKEAAATPPPPIKPPPAEANPLTPPPKPIVVEKKEERPIWKRWWVWAAGAGAVAVIAAVAVGLAVGLSTKLPSGSLGTIDAR